MTRPSLPVQMDVETVDQDTIKSKCLILHCGDKILDIDHPQHSEYARDGEADFLDAYTKEVTEYYWNLDRYLKRQYLFVTPEIRERYRFKRDQDNGVGVVFLAGAAAGKSSSAEFCGANIPRSFYLGKGEETLLTFTYRDRFMTSGEFSEFRIESQEDVLDCLKSFGRSKVHERYRLNIVHSILARNGVFPISVGDLEQVDISWKAYAGHRLDSDSHVLPLEYAPWGPQRYIVIFKDQGRAVFHSAEQGRRRELERLGLSRDDLKHRFVDSVFTAARNSNLVRWDPFGVYERITNMNHLFLGRWYSSGRARGILNNWDKDLLFRSIDIDFFDLPEDPINILGIIEEVRALVPGIEPGAVISHISFDAVRAEILASEKVRAAVTAEVESMRECIGRMSENAEIHRHFIKYLEERIKVLKRMLE